MVFGFGVVFETPLILNLSYLNIVTYKTLVNSRKYVIIIVFIVGALLTPRIALASCHGNTSLSNVRTISSDHKILQKK